MKKSLVRFKSVTRAQRAANQLQTRQIPCSLVRTPRALDPRGCGYSLLLPAGAVPEALEALRQQGIGWEGISPAEPAL